jgi:hypothetical protein
VLDELTIDHIFGKCLLSVYKDSKDGDTADIGGRSGASTAASFPVGGADGAVTAS